MKPEEERLMTTEPGCTDVKWVARNPSFRTETDSVSELCDSASGLLATDLLKTASIFVFLSVARRRFAEVWYEWDWTFLISV